MVELATARAGPQETEQSLGFGLVSYLEDLAAPSCGYSRSRSRTGRQ